MTTFVNYGLGQNKMLANIISGYGVFILELLTIAFIAVIVGVRLLSGKSHKSTGELQVTDLSEVFQQKQKQLASFHLQGKALKQQEKAEKKAQKAQAKMENAEKKAPKRLPHTFVLDFQGDVQASQTNALREEISAIIAIAQPQDKVLLRLESPGGVVHGYGLAASQLKRLKEHDIPLIIAVDKVAASGGYMMACVADKLVAAPFAIVGSIGVVAQIPNIYRLLRKHDVEMNVMTAGDYKRTMTVMGKNTHKGREKFQQELDETHMLFKDFVQNQRPAVDIEKVATGEHWYAEQGIALGLVDEIATSDDLLLQALQDKQQKVIGLSYQCKKTLLQKLSQQAEETSHRLLSRWLFNNTYERIQ